LAMILISKEHKERQREKQIQDGVQEKTTGMHLIQKTITPPLQVKWSVPKWNANILFISKYINNNKSAGYLQEIASSGQLINDDNTIDTLTYYPRLTSM
jgi:hypothetical protein